MKPLKGDQQLRSVSLSCSVALQALKPKSSPRTRRGLDASTDRGLTESSGEVFSLDILSHRMSVIAVNNSCRRKVGGSEQTQDCWCPNRYACPLSCSRVCDYLLACSGCIPFDCPRDVFSNERSGRLLLGRPVQGKVVFTRA